MPDPSVWTIPANGAEPVQESYGFLTEVLPSYNGHEQRVKLRAIPLERIEFGILADGREAQLAQSLIWGLHDEALVVPLWQYGSILSGSVSIGASLLPITDAADIPYRRSVDNGGYAVVWRDPFTWELFSVSSTSGSGVATSDTATANWASGSAYVFPARLARFADAPLVTWLNSRVLEARLKFTGEQT